MKTYKVTRQTSATEFKDSTIEAESEKEAWEKANLYPVGIVTKVKAVKPKMKTVAIERLSYEKQIYNADIEPRQSIRLYGSYLNHCEYVRDETGRVTRIDAPKAFDLTFKIGDLAEYDSYNLKYTGKIVAIGEKTVTIDASGTGERMKRLDLWHFAWRNWDFDAVKIAAHNSEERMYI